MLMGNDTRERRKLKIDRKESRQKSPWGMDRIRLFCAGIGTGLLLGAAVIVLLATGFFPSHALEELRLVSNNGTGMNRGETLTVMDAAEIFLDGYTDSGDRAVYYLFSQTPLTQEQSAVLAQTGIRYSSQSPIRLTSSDSQEKSGYLYIQQTEGEESRLTEYKVSFLESLGEIRLEATADASGMLSVEVGQVLRFQGEGKIYYTEDGSVPALVRDASGDMFLNGESFRVADSNRIKGVETNELTVPEEWGLEETKTLQVIAYKEGFDFSQIYTFHLKITPKQDETKEPAQPPVSLPASGSPVKLEDKIYLTTETPDSTILYTLDGSQPSYEVRVGDKSQGEDDYVLELKGNTRQYGRDTSYIEVSTFGASPGETILLRSKTIQLDMSRGMRLLEDSPTINFSYQISQAEAVINPEILPETKAEEPTVVQPGDKLLLSCATPGARIYYTLDGTSPVFQEDGTMADNTSLYNPQKAIVVSEGSGSLTITAIAVKEGMNNSSLIQFTYQYPAQLAPPYAIPGEGTISANTEVVLGSIEEGARIYYTLDGSEPSLSNGNLYGAPILLAQDTIVKAVTIVEGRSSAVETLTYYVADELTAPIPSVPSGSVLASGTIIRLSVQKGAVISYTTDGSNPREGSPLTGDRVTITGEPGASITLMTCAKGSDYSDSPVATYVYTISNYKNGVLAESVSETGVKKGDQISLKTDVTNGVIYYETGGANPAVGGIQGNSVEVGAAEDKGEFILKVMALPEGAESDGTFATYTFAYRKKLASPAASIPNGAVLLKEQEVQLFAEEGEIYYTLDDSLPSQEARLYTKPIRVTEPVTIRAVAVSEDGNESEATSFAYTFAEQTEPPLFSLQSGEVKAGIKLTISSSTPGAVIYYTLDGQKPDLNYSQNLYLYSGPVTLNKAVRIKAIAVADKMAESEVTSEVYTILPTQQEEEREKILTDHMKESRLISRGDYLKEAGTVYGDFILRSAATGVIISAKEETIPVESGIEVTQMPVSESLNRSVSVSAGIGYGAAVSYEVILTCDGEVIQPQGVVELGLPIPQKYSNTPISIAYVDDEGKVELYETRRENGMAYALVNRFDRYCIVAPVDWEEQETKEGWKRLTPAAGVVLLVGGCLFLWAGKKGKREKSSLLDD